MKDSLVKSIAIVLILLCSACDAEHAIDIKDTRGPDCEYRECIACDIGLVEYVTQFKRLYGERESVFLELIEIAKGIKQNKYPQDFYTIYGPYLMQWVFDREDGDLIYKVLLENGTNAYSSISGKFTTAELVVENSNNLAAFKTLVSLGELERCPAILNELILAAANTKQFDKLKLLEKLKK